MLAVAAASTQPLPLIQAGASAVLIVSLQSPESGGERIVDALGGGVALFISQVLLPPSPASLLKGAGREALGSLGEGLRGSVRALADGGVAAAGAALERLRTEEQSVMTGLAAARETSGKVVHRTLRGRREANGSGASTPASGSWTFSPETSCSSRAPRTASWMSASWHRGG